MLDCHAESLKDDVCGFDQWLDNHIGLSPHQTNWSIGRLAATLEGLNLRYHVLVGSSGFDSVYASAPNGLAMSIAGLPVGNYTPSRPLGGGAVDLCNVGSCPNSTSGLY